jgi:hypothetical protein
MLKILDSFVLTENCTLFILWQLCLIDNSVCEERLVKDPFGNAGQSGELIIHHLSHFSVETTAQVEKIF